jgi:hypothetical protein
MQALMQGKFNKNYQNLLDEYCGLDKLRYKIFLISDPANECKRCAS